MNGIDIEMAYLFNRMPAHPARVSARDGNIDVGDVGCEPARSRIVIRRCIDSGCSLIGRALPAIAAELAECARGGAVDNRLHIVIWSSLSASHIHTKRFISAMRRRIPAAVGQIEPAHERDGIVHNDNFLMVRTAERMCAVEPKVQPRAQMRAPAELVEWQPFAVFNVRRVVTQKGAPSLAWRLASLGHGLGDARLRDVKPELEQFAVDARRSPNRVLDAHPPDQHAEVRLDLRPASQ